MTNRRNAKLFTLTRNGRLTKDARYFSNKMDAKSARDELNGGRLPDNDNGWRVTIGPDHRRYASC